MEKAIREAKRIRRNLQRLRQLHHNTRYRPYRWGTDLAGACGLASLLLSIALDDLDILRGKTGHVWTKVGDTIIDITASQFNGYTADGTFDVEEPISGVLVTKQPRFFHLPVETVGRRTYLEIVNGNWYTTEDHRHWTKLADYWLV